MRGKLILRQDHLFDIYLPGVYCQSPSAAPLSLVCRGSDDPWPLSSQFALGGFYAGDTKFLYGRLVTRRRQAESSTAKFYSAAPLPALLTRFGSLRASTAHFDSWTASLSKRPD